MNEPLADLYYEKLQKTTTPIPLLISFIKSIFDWNDSDVNHLYPKIGRAVKLYGSNAVFFAILDSAEGYDINSSSIHRLIFHFSKKKLKNKYMNLPKDLTEISTNQLESFMEERELIIPKLNPSLTKEEEEKMEELEMTMEEMKELEGKVIF
jgi:hypothetical protein